jgi:actin-related protein
MFQDLTSLVLDIGTYQTRIGYGGDEAPKIVTPSYIAYPSPSPNET